jgi:hypothetical protein
VGRAAVILALAASLIAIGACLTIGAEASPTPVPMLEPGDPRSEGAGPGLVGSPLLVLAAVVALGLTTALLTALVVRLSRRG